MHFAEGCEYLCKSCGHRRIYNPCVLQQLARDVVCEEDLMLEPREGESPPLSSELQQLVGTLGRDAAHLSSHLYIEAITAGYRSRNLARLGSEAASIAPRIRVSREAQSHLNKAEELFGKRDFRGALRSYEQAEEIDPRSSMIKLHKGDALYSSGKFEDAVRCYREAIAIDPLNHQAYRYLADTYFRVRNPSEAWKALWSAVICNPAYEKAWKDIEVLATAGQYTVHRHRIPKLAIPSPGVDGKRIAILEATLSGKPPAIREAWERFGQTWADMLARAPVDPWHKKRRRIGDELAAYEALAMSWSASRSADPSLKDEALDFVARVNTDGMLDAFVFLEDFSEDLRQDYEKWKQLDPGKAQLYLRNYVIVVNRPPR